LYDYPLFHVLELVQLQTIIHHLLQELVVVGAVLC
jgi:hypothetical protein